MSIIHTWTGRNVDVRAPKLEDVDIRDIAHALAHINRFTGHTHGTYTVAEHSVLCSYFGNPDEALEKLMHDASEAYLGDVSSPLKALLQPQYGVLETMWQAAISRKFNLGALDSREVKRIDHLTLLVEMEHKLSRPGLGVSVPADWPQEDAQVLSQLRYHILNPTGFGHKYWEQAFLNRFHELVAERALAQIDSNAQVKPVESEA